MTARIYVGRVMHARREPVVHRFEYPLYWYALDLDALDELDRRVRLFGYNRPRLVSLWDRDYLRGEGAIREKLVRELAAAGCADGVARVELVTMLRYLHYVFIPVSFYYCYRADGTLRAVVAEVNNTFGERHLYLLEPAAGAAFPVRCTAAKAMHVSPFNDLRGHYEFFFSALDESMDIRIDLVRDGRPVLHARLTGQARPLTDVELRRTLVRYPLAAALNMPRIVWEAGRLYFMKKLPVHPKPAPSSPMTRPAAPSLRERLGWRGTEALLGRLQRCRLRVTLPDGSSREFGGREAGREAELAVRDWAMFGRVLRSGDVGFGEAFMHGEWDSGDLAGLMTLMAENTEWLSGAPAGPAAWVRRLRHRARRNTRPGSRRNIRAHYDLGNDFYRLFLDEGLNYSCAVFADPGEPLEQAQRRKLESILGKARLGPADHVLEIGCGWGSFALEAARTTGCRVTGLSLSREQVALARERVAAAGLADRVAIELLDYRDVRGQFSRIVSIEMLEAVGHDFYGTFFAACDRLLAPGGWAVIQTITIPDQRYEAYRRRPDWIQQHIFPGGHLPSLTGLCRAMTRHSRFVVEDLENIGPHYAPTLAEWRRRFERQREALLTLGFDEVFQRKWRYYFSYCEAGFAARLLNGLQLVLRRPGELRGAVG